MVLAADIADRIPPASLVSVWAGPLSGPAWVAHRVEEIHYAASMIKVPLVIAAYAAAESGALDLDAPVRVHNEFVSAADDSTFAMDPGEDSDGAPWALLGRTTTLRWLCRRAIVRSSNLSTNLIWAAVGAERVASVLHSAGASQTMMTRGIEDAAARTAGYDNRVSALDLARLFSCLASGTLVGADSTAELRSMLAAQELTDGIPAGLPQGTGVEHKTGSITQVSHDGGIVLPPLGPPYVLVVCTTGAGTDEQGTALIAAISAAVWAARADAER